MFLRVFLIILIGVGALSAAIGLNAYRDSKYYNITGYQFSWNQKKWTETDRRINAVLTALSTAGFVAGVVALMGGFILLLVSGLNSK